MSWLKRLNPRRKKSEKEAGEMSWLKRLKPRRKKSESSLVKYAMHELRAVGLLDGDSDYGGMLAAAVIDLLRVFSAQGHSGFSAGRTVQLFERLAMFKPLSPLTGADDEWNEVGDGVYQNKRCSHVFKRGGVAYDARGKIFQRPDGVAYVSRASQVPVTFPYMPKSEIVPVQNGASEDCTLGGL